MPLRPQRDERPIGILGLGVYLPERVMGNDEWTAYVDTSDEWITSRTGIERRRIAAGGETSADLATAAARSALERAGLSPRAIREIIVATDTPEVLVPDTAAFVQHRLGSGEIPAYDLAGSGCAGFLQAVDVARSRVATGTEPVLVIGVEVLSKLMDWGDRNTAVLFGDAAAAAVVGRGDGAVEIVAAVAGTDGSQAEILGIQLLGTGGPGEPAARRDLKLKIVMHGREVFKEAVRRMSAASRQVLERAGVGISDLALVVPHQANLRILRAVAKALAVPEEKMVINVQEYGNTGSASVPLALWEAERAGRIRPGDLVLLTSFGAGFHWAAMLLRY